MGISFNRITSSFIFQRLISPSSFMTPSSQSTASIEQMSSSNSVEKKSFSSTDSFARPWQLPGNNSVRPAHKLHLFNTLIKQKVPFVPLQGNTVKWYSCGPTVYDAAHLGHARNYVTFDILRRVLEGFFGYEVLYVMNITDIDDKIILRARQGWLVDQYKRKHQEKIDRDELTQYLDEFVKGKKLDQDPPAQSLGEEEVSKFRLAQETAAKARKELQDLSTPASVLLSSFTDILSYILDKNLGHTVTDQAIFRSLAAYWEADFLQDMRSLNVMPANYMTRVSEYIPDIIDYVQGIIDRGYGYVVSRSTSNINSPSSVYFDVPGFQEKGHPYARLCPSSAGNSQFFEESEGALGVKLTGKRDPRDFALWKESKPGEPSWPSPWGPGRPGWHIECSAMAGAVLPGRLDIHSGGSDLAFPHHDNELAQAEAFADSPPNEPWVTYFLHAGHVHISGLKMSKRLKNFISIKEALKRNTPRQLRVLFLLHLWSATMTYQEESMEEAKAVDTTLVNYFANTLAHLRRLLAHTPESMPPTRQFRPEIEGKILEALWRCQGLVYEALCDSIDTPRVIDCILTLISQLNNYLGSNSSTLDHETLITVGSYVARLMNTFGLVFEDAQAILNLNAAHSSLAENAVDKWTVLEPVLTPVAHLRNTLRQAALGAARDNPLRQVILDSCDKLRADLSCQGIVFEDSIESSTLVKLLSTSEIEARLGERNEKEVSNLANQMQSSLSLEARREKARAEKAEKARIPPEQYFKTLYGQEYSAFDEQGVPTHDSAREPLSKNARKKVLKEMETHKELYEKHSSSK